MTDAFDELERQLRGAVRARGARSRRLRRRSRRGSTALAVAALLVVSAGALAAGGVIPIGSPAEKHPPSEVGYPGGALVRGSARLLPITAPDPAGGPPWSMRVLSTRRGEGCLQVGRLLDGKLGALGRDGAFGDDGRFHELAPTDFGAERACSLLDGAQRLFVNAVVGDLPASAWKGAYHNLGCVPSTAGRYERYAEGNLHKPYPVCPQRDERNVYYGLLGPQAESVTYELEGRARTVPTVGPEGAYLIVTRASAKQLFNFDAGGTEDVVPVDGPITGLHYRDGATCHLTSKSWIGGRDACTPALRVPLGWTAPPPAPSAAQVAAPVHARLVPARGPRRRGGYELLVSFTSRVAIQSARASYTVQFHEAGQPPQIHTFGPLRPSYPAAGQTVSTQIGGARGGLRAGRIDGEVIYRYQRGPGGLEEDGGTVKHTVGRFTLTVP